MLGPRPEAPARAVPANVRGDAAEDAAEVDALLEVLESGRFGVQYEPMIEVTTGQTLAHEALARFHREDDALIPPAPVFAWLHREPTLLVETELRLKRLQLERAPGHTVFVNLDPDSWANAPDGGAAFTEVLTGTAIDVVVEAIESLEAVDLVHGRDMVDGLQRAGLPFALDDVGAASGLICFDMLACADYIKFDRSLIESRDPRRLALVQSLVDVAVRTGARTVLEGVETASDLALARDLGVSLAQGFLFRDRFVQVAPEARP